MLDRVSFKVELTTSILRLAIALEKLNVLPSDRADKGVCGCLFIEAEIIGGEVLVLSDTGISNC
jgi:hypothetical protein